MTELYPVYVFNFLGEAFKDGQPLSCDKLGNDWPTGSDPCFNQYCYPK